MNETIKTILNRRSTRGFKMEQIKDEEIKAIMNCGIYAPSAMDTQNWHFTVVQNKDLIEKINNDLKEFLPEAAKTRALERNKGNENYSSFYNAPTLVIVSGREDDSWSTINCALATENICVAAESLNIGSCIIGMLVYLFNSPKGENYFHELGIPQGYKFLYGISLGYKSMIMPLPAKLTNTVDYIK